MSVSFVGVGPQVVHVYASANRPAVNTIAVPFTVALSYTNTLVGVDVDAFG